MYLCFSYRTDFETTLQNAQSAHRELYQHIEIREMRSSAIVLNIDKFVNMADIYGVEHGFGRHLSRDKIAVLATILNQVGVASESVLRRLKLPSANGRYRFDRSLNEQTSGVQDAGTMTDERVRDADHDVGNVTAPSVEELLEIRAKVIISNAPRGRLAIRSSRGSVRKAATTREELYRYVVDNIPDWRQSLSHR